MKKIYSGTAPFFYKKFFTLILFSFVVLTTFVQAQTVFSDAEIRSFREKGISNTALQNAGLEERNNVPDITKADRSSTFGGNIDPSFNASITDGTGYVNETATQPDGKIIAVGTFVKSNGIRSGSISRFNSDGTLDTSFNNGGSGADNLVNAVSLQADGKIVIGGNFLNYNGQPMNRLARLNIDGSLDATFTHNLNFAAEIYDVVVQPDGKILVGGLFNALVGNPTRGRIIRLNADGSVDSSFNNGGGANGGVRKIVYQSDGKILIGGLFTFYAGASRGRIARLNSDGSIDSTFTTGTGATGEVKQIVIQPDGKILIGGFFGNYNGTITNVARLNSDGSFDTAFIIDISQNAAILVFSFALQSNGKIVVGYLDDFDTSSTTSKIIRFNPDATIDSSFTTGFVGRFVTRSVETQPDGKLLIGGNFLSYNNQEHIRLARTDTNGILDTSFNPAASTIGNVQAITTQSDGKILVGGNFQYVNGVRRALMARLNIDGSLDNTFNPGNGLVGNVYSIKLQSDGKILVGGFFNGDENFPASALVRLNTDGSIDQRMDLLTNVFVFGVYGIDIQPDGKIVAGGQIVDNMFNNIIVSRLNTDGTLDSSFNLQTRMTIPYFIYSVKIQSDGKILIGKNTSTAPSEGLLRLNGDGSLDNSFSASIFRVRDIALTNTGKFYIGGSFNAVNISRINSDGSVDNTFNPGSGANNEVRALELQSDGKVIIGGFFTNYNGNTVNYLARINSDGSLDSTFNSGSGASNAVFALKLQNDGKLLVGGQFLDYNGIEHPGLVRLRTDSSANSTPFDFDGDGKSDISVFRPSNGAWYINQSTAGFTGVTFGFGSDILTPADYDGDGKTDVAVFRPSAGGWYRLNSSDGTFTGLQWGLSTDIPIPADFDGDGKADVNVFRPSDGGWYRLNSSTGAFVGLNFGQNGDKPLIANFDGDGKNDIAVFRPSTASFYSLDSSTGNFRGVAFGLSTDIPTLGDFDGDGKTDVAVFRPSNGAWYRLNSSTGAFFGTLFGQNGDIPVPADYDGDGRADIAVFRNGNWYYLRSSNGAFVGESFGFGTDKPIPAAFR